MRVAAGLLVLAAGVATVYALCVEMDDDETTTEVNRPLGTGCPDRACVDLNCTGSIVCYKTDDIPDRQFFDNPARASAMSVGSRTSTAADVTEFERDASERLLPQAFEVE